MEHFLAQVALLLSLLHKDLNKFGLLLDQQKIKIILAGDLFLRKVMLHLATF